MVHPKARTKSGDQGSTSTLFVFTIKSLHHRLEHSVSSSFEICVMVALSAEHADDILADFQQPTIRERNQAVNKGSVAK